nr:hypothetical protein [Tanacetum cinerariifolium]
MVHKHVMPFDEDDIAFMVDGMWWAKTACILAGQHAVVLAAMVGCDETLTSFSRHYYVSLRVKSAFIFAGQHVVVLAAIAGRIPFSPSRVRKSELIVSWKTRSVRGGWDWDWDCEKCSSIT